MEKTVQHVAWVLWNGRRPGKWTNDHLTVDDKFTLCGRRIPGDSFSYDHSGRGIVCERCQKSLDKKA